MNPLHLSPPEVLAYGRTFAVCSALNIKDPLVLNTIFNVLNQRMYVPENINFARDCRPYLFGTKSDRNGKPTTLPYIPAWARAGVNYAARTNLARFAPGDWYENWWDLYVQTMGLDPNAHPEHIPLAETFDAMYGSLAVDEDRIMQAILSGRLVTERAQIRRMDLTPVPDWED